MTPPPDAAESRRLVYVLLIVLAAGLASGRILSAERLFEPSVHRADSDASTPRPAWPRSRPDPWPTFSSNDRSRWAVVRALVDEGTFVIGRRNAMMVLASGPAALAAQDPIQAAALLQAGYLARVGSDRGIIFEEGFQSVDKVLHPARLEFYSTKPPLLSLLAAGEYWLLKKAFGWSIVDQRWEVIRTILFTFNVVPLVLYLAILAWLAECFGGSDWAKFFIVAAGGFATLVNPFLVTFNNHTIAVASVAVTLYALLQIVSGAGPWMFVLAGLAAGFTACNELPAASLAVGLGVYLLWKAPGRTLLFYVPAALLPAAAMLAANYIQLGQVRPAYAEFGGPWYQYEGSHWRLPPGGTKRGIDFAGRNGETKAVYALHLLVGHHGIFSLTPIMLLAVAGMAMGVGRLITDWKRGRESPLAPLSPLGRGVGGEGRELHQPLDSSAIQGRPLTPNPSPQRGEGSKGNPSPQRGEGSKGNSSPRRGEGRKELAPLLALFTLLVSLVVIAFYIVKSDNYGGWSNGPRWLMWMTPLWLLVMLPALDGLGRSRIGRVLALLLLGLSAMSMSYQQWNPWRHPWIYNWMESRGWISY